MYHLTVQTGASKGATWHFQGDTVRLGRGADCDIKISGDSAVSRVHCEIWLDGQVVKVKNLSRRSVTLKNGKVIKESTLGPGDTITVGMTTLMFGLDAVERRKAREAALDYQTRAVGTADAVYLGGRDSHDEYSARLDLVGDLAELYRISNEFNEAENLKKLEATLVDAFEQRFAPAWYWISRTNPASQELRVARQSHEPYPEMTALAYEAMARAVDCMNGALIQCPSSSSSEQAYQTLIVCPMVSGGRAFGAIALANRPTDKAYDENDLQFLLALGRSVAPCIRSIERTEELERQIKQLRETQIEAVELVGDSPELQRVKATLAHAAQSHLNVLILGESGTGKELASRIVHQRSDQSHGPFVTVNCAAIPAEMLESELFGHEKGAFTGAATSRKGLIEMADGGTLFLDEVGDLSLANQARVLRVLENGTFRKLGSDTVKQVTFRTVSATNKNLPELVRRGEFREDLYHRINGFEIWIPPLRSRPSDIPLLAEHFFRQGVRLAKRPVKGIDDRAMQALISASWSGNARQLKNAIERAIAIAAGDTIQADDLVGISTAGAGSPAVGLTLEDAEKRHIAEVIQRCDGEVAKAADVLGVSRSTLYSKIKKLGITW